MKVLYIDIDSLRRDHIGCYGYERPTTPNLDRIAAEGARFTNMYAADTPCVPARASIFTGRWGIKTGLLTHGERAQSIGDFGRPDGELNTKPWEEDSRYAGPTYPPFGSRAPQVQEHLAVQRGEAGLRTAAVSTFADQASWFRTGWNAYYRPQWHLAHSRVQAPQITAHALAWLEDHAQDDFFLYVHYWDPHQSYKSPQSYIDTMLAYPPPDWPPDERIREDAERYAHMPNSAGSHRIWGKEDFDYW
ncbi:MAG: sulfatase-like hydrolase/transferase, partial [Chloroflexota bacterium]|nr:sulfatase-like hydrolase/transferase [Chloroflexota bacterium]